MRSSWTVLPLLAGIISASVAVPCSAAESRRTAIVRAIESTRDSVVNIHGQKLVAGADDEPAGELRRVNGMGTGVVIDSRGYIVTNYHVVEGVRRIEVTMASGRTTTATLVSHDPRIDLAVIKVGVDSPLPVITIGTSGDIMIGETVLALGNAYGYEHTVTRGIVSALHRSVEVSRTQHYDDLIQTDASINPGNSGGPLLNIDGEMIGINVAVRAGAQGIGFAIPIDRVLKVVTELMSVERVDRTWHGIVAKGDGQRGAVVETVHRESPAESVGLKAGDVITRIGDLSVSSQLDIERALLGHKAGDSVPMTLVRRRPPDRDFAGSGPEADAVTRGPLLARDRRAVAVDAGGKGAEAAGPLPWRPAHHGGPRRRPGPRAGHPRGRHPRRSARLGDDLARQHRLRSRQGRRGRAEAAEILCPPRP